MTRSISLRDSTQRKYDAVSRLVAQTDPRGKTTRFGYDNLNRITQIVDALNGVTAFTYDGNGNLLTVTDARGHTVAFEYDSMDRLVRRVDPLARGETFAYDGAGNLTQTTDRKGQVSTFTYDALGRRVRGEFPDGSVVDLSHDSAGRLIRIDDTADPHRPILRTYDTLDRLVTESTALGSIAYEYDLLGRRTKMTVAGEAPIEYTYDANSRLRTIAKSPLAPATFEYDPNDRRTRLTLPNGVATEYVYDAASRLTGLIYRNALGVLGDLTYEYDGTDNVTAIGGSLAQTLLPDSVTSASYDEANQQLTFGGAVFTYDANGNLTTRTDATGTTVYTWDTRNRLVEVVTPTDTASFAYDGLSRRVRTIVGPVIRDYLYDGADIALERGPTGTKPHLRSLAMDELLGRGATEFPLLDHLGSALALTDETGAITTRYVYAPFGEVAVTGTPADNPIQFTGREADPTGLYYYRARYYDPRRGRFLSEDPIGHLSGSVNFYGYVDQNPIRFTDPTGEVAPVIVAAIFVAGAGGWAATFAELTEWRRGGTPQDVTNAGIAAGTGAVVGSTVALTIQNPAAGVAAASATGGFVENAIRQLQRPPEQRSGSEFVRETATSTLFGLLGGGIAQRVVPKRFITKMVLAKIKDLSTGAVRRVPWKIFQESRQLIDRARPLVPAAVFSGVSNLWLRPYIGISGRK